MRAAKIRRGRVFFHRISGVPQRNAGRGLRLGKYFENGPFGSIHRKNPFASGGTNAYFGKRSGPTPGSWHQGSTLSAYFWDPPLDPDFHGRPGGKGNSVHLAGQGGVGAEVGSSFLHDVNLQRPLLRPSIQ